jgi:hypothetical protein
MVTSEQIRAQLSRILASTVFDQADRASAFLNFVVTTSLTGRADPIVRVEAGRRRNRLKMYYDSEGSLDPILITLPKGGYVRDFAVAACRGRLRRGEPQGKTGDMRVPRKEVKLSLSESLPRWTLRPHARNRPA